METKICRTCDIEKSLEEFYKNSRMKDGRLSKCKECIKRERKENYRANKDKEKETVKKYYYRNREEILERRSRQYYNK